MICGQALKANIPDKLFLQKAPRTTVEKKPLSLIMLLPKKVFHCLNDTVSLEG